VAESRALTPTIHSRCCAIARRAAGTSAASMFISSPPAATPVLAMFRKIRTRFGAACATRTSASMLSDPADPPSTIDVVPSRSSIAGVMSGAPTWTCRSMRPGVTILPRASRTSAASAAAMSGWIARMRPPAIATSATRSIAGRVEDAPP
jgi:hypothetical protein